MKYKVLRVTWVCLLAAVVVVLAPLKGAEATPVTFGFSGHITSVLDCENLLGGAVSEGDLFTGQFTYDPAAPDTDPDPTVGAYWFNTVPHGLSVTINGLSFGSDPNATFFLAEVFDGGSADKVSLTSFSNLMPVLDGGLSLILLELVDPAGRAVANTDLPVSYNLDAWSQGCSTLTLGTGDCLSEYTLHGAIDRIEKVPVEAIPEPGSMLLIGSGLLGILTLSRQSRKQ